MRLIVSITFALAGFTLLAQTPPPGSIVIRPKGSTTPSTTAPSETMPKVILQSDPDRPGYYVIRPSGRSSIPGSAMLPPPRENIPHLEIIRPKPMNTDGPVPAPPIFPHREPHPPPAHTAQRAPAPGSPSRGEGEYVRSIPL